MRFQQDLLAVDCACSQLSSNSHQIPVSAVKPRPREAGAATSSPSATIYPKTCDTELTYPKVSYLSQHLWHRANFACRNNILLNLSLHCGCTHGQVANDGMGNQQETQRCFPPEGAEDSLSAPSNTPGSSGEGRLLNLMFKQMIPLERAPCARIRLSQKFNSLISSGGASAAAVFGDGFGGHLVWGQFERSRVDTVSISCQAEWHLPGKQLNLGMQPACLISSLSPG